MMSMVVYGDSIQEFKLNVAGMMFWHVNRVLLNWNGWEFWATAALVGSVVTDTACGFFSCNTEGGSLASWPDFVDSHGVTFFFDCELSKSDNCSIWLSEVRMYFRTPSRLLWPVHSIISCSSTLAWYGLIYKADWTRRLADWVWHMCAESYR